MVRTAYQVFKAGFAEKADIYHFHDPELIPAGVLLKLMGKRVIYDVHEDLPRQMLKKDWLPAYMRRVIGRIMGTLEQWSALKLDGIVAATPAIAKRFPSHKTITVHNFPILKEFQPSNRTCTERKWFAYVGGLENIRGVTEMVRAMELLPSESGARLMLAGKFDPPGLLDEVRRLPGWQHVTHLGWQSRAGVAGLLSSVRAGLVVLHRYPHFLESYPIKLFEYMAVGIPVIASDFPLWRSIVEKEGCGILVDPHDPTAIAKALDWVLQNPEQAKAMGRRGVSAVRARYNWKQEELKLTAFYQRFSRSNTAPTHVGTVVDVRS